MRILSIQSNGMISSGQCVIFSIPVLVTKSVFSIPTAPTWGMTNLGSKAKTIFSSRI